MFDVETAGENRGVCHLNNVTWMSLATNGACIVVPFGHPLGTKQIGEHKEPRMCSDGKIRKYTVPDWEAPPPQISPGNFFEIVKPLFFSERITKIAHGAVFDISSTAKYWGEVMPPPYDDTIICDWLLESDRKRYGLKYRAIEKYGFHYDDENVGKCVEKYPFGMVAQYAYYDAKIPWLMWNDYRPRIHAEGLDSVHALELDVLNVLVGMRLAGSRVDVPRLERLKDDLAERRVKSEAEVYRAAGRSFNINSKPQLQQVLFDSKRNGGQGLKPWKRTDTGKAADEKGDDIGAFKGWSVDGDVLAGYPDNPVAAEVHKYAEIQKLLSTYVMAYLGDPQAKDKPRQIFSSRIHADFVQYGTNTGRFSCVAGDTLIETSRGVFRFDEYMPQDGDEVPTHTGRWGKVLRKIYKGRSKMFRVRLYNGAEIKCTATHRLMTSDGWKCVGDLNTGDKVLSYDGFQEVHKRQREDTASPGVVLRESGEAYYPSGSGYDGDDVSQRTRSTEATALTRNAKERTEPPLLSLKDARQESNARTEWFPAPQLSRSHIRWEWLSSDKGWLEVHPFASARNGQSTWTKEATTLAGCAPYRRGPLQQRYRQLGTGNYVWSWEAALQEVTVGEIASLGTMGVWDVEVEGDHSYVTQGFLNHNCRAPNLQNIPRPDTELGKLIRGAWVADPGYKLVVADYGQIELVLFAHFAGKGALYEGFLNGEDPHQVTADQVGIERQAGKRLNFTMGFGAGPYEVARQLGVSPDKAKKILNDHQRAFPELYALKKDILKLCRSRTPPYVKTLLGRKRYLPRINSPVEKLRGYAERQAVSAAIQGSAADLMKLSLVRADSMLAEHVPDAYLELTIHDEMVVQCPEDQVEFCMDVLRDAMTGVGIQELIAVPLTIDLKSVDSWADAK